MNQSVVINGAFAVLNLFFFATTGSLMSLGVALFGIWVCYYVWSKE